MVMGGAATAFGFFLLGPVPVLHIPRRVPLALDFVQVTFFLCWKSQTIS